MKKPLPSVDRVMALLSYDPETGVLTRKRSWGKHKEGSAAGCVSNHGYYRISIEGRLCLAHHIAWIMIFGCWPPTAVDHINGDRLDNRACNLRLATKSQNAANSGIRVDNRTGYKGVSFVKRKGKYLATIRKDGKTVYLGMFDKAEAAAETYEKAAVELFGEFARAS